MSTDYLDKNMVDSALYFNQKGLDIARLIPSYSQIADGLLIRSRIDSARNDFEGAFNNFKRGQTINDSILDNEHKSRIVEMKIIYEVDKKESENQLLITQNQLKERMINGQRLALFGFIFLVLLLLVSIYLLNRTRKKIAAQKEVIAANNLRLQELNQTKDKFISIIAHDLRSPFNSLLGLLQELSENYKSYTDEEKIHIIETLYVSSTNTYGLLVNLLDWTLAQRSGFENKPTDTNLHYAVENVFKFLSGRAQQKNHRLINQVERELTVFVDQNILNNVIINLVNNAIKFTKDEGLIEVSAIVQLDGQVRIFVQDNGIGIPTDKMKQLFDLDSDFKRKGTSNEMGTGLGLVLVKDFVKMSQGELFVESEEGKGSTFSFTLPASAPKG
jgi:signal transduction histidine kinase